jgi:hypothetical protein
MEAAAVPDQFLKILAALEELKTILKSFSMPRSPEIGFLLGALAKAQGCYKVLVTNEEAASGKFANLEAILFAVKDALSDNGLALYQYLELQDEGSGAALLKTILGHESGQYISSTARVFSGKTDRATGNSYEIHKRLHALMLLGIAPSSCDPIAFDDDGGEQEEEVVVERIKNPKKKMVDPNAVITKDRYDQLLAELDNYTDIAESIMSTYKIDTLADLPNEVFHDALSKVRRIKKTAEDYENRKK